MDLAVGCVKRALRTPAEMCRPPGSNQIAVRTVLPLTPHGQFTRVKDRGRRGAKMFDLASSFQVLCQLYFFRDYPRFLCIGLLSGGRIIAW
jgi:hypothetical protein